MFFQVGSFRENFLHFQGVCVAGLGFGCRRVLVAGGQRQIGGVCLWCRRVLVAGRQRRIGGVCLWFLGRETLNKGLCFFIRDGVVSGTHGASVVQGLVGANQCMEAPWLREPKCNRAARSEASLWLGRR